MQDIAIHIYEYLPIKDIYSLTLVNSSFNKAFKNSNLWKLLLERDYVWKYEDIMKENYYAIYRLCIKLDCVKVSLKLNYNIGELFNKKGLTLSNNQLSSLPVEIGQLINLQKLYLCNNQLIEQAKKLLPNNYIY